MYTVASWVIVQIADILLPTFNAPLWVNQTLIVILALGFPIALILAWMLDITPGGIQTADAVENPSVVVESTSNPITSLALGLLTLAVVFLFIDRFFLNEIDPEQNQTPIVSSLDVSELSRTFINLEPLQRRVQGGYTSFDFTSDGNTIVYTSFSNGTYKLHRRELSQLTTETIAENEDGVFLPKISPDNSRVLYFRNSNLAIVPMEGGAPQEIASFVVPNSYDWLSDDTVVYTQNPDFLVQLVSTTGENLGTLNRNLRRNGIYIDPHPIIGTQKVLFSVSDDGWNIHVVDFESGVSQLLVRDGFEAQLMPSGHLTFMRNNYLWAVPIDLETFEVTGREVPLVEGIQNVFNYGAAAYAVSNRGELIYILGESEIVESSYLQWVNLDGNTERIGLRPREFREITISPNGQMLATTIVQPSGSSDIWVYNFNTGALDVLTDTGGAMNPVWSPDSRQIAFNDSQSNLGLRIVDASGSTAAEQLTLDDVLTGPGAFSPDGSKLVYIYGDPSNFDMGLLDLSSNVLSESDLLASNVVERQPAFSPNGNWLAYMARDTGNDEVYIRPFPNVDDDRIRVSPDGGREPLWSSDGNYLYFIIPVIQDLVRVRVNQEDGIEIGEPEFVTKLSRVYSNDPSYSLMPNEDRVLVLEPAEELEPDLEFHSSQAIFVDNWIEEVQRVAAASSAAGDP